MLKTLKDFLKKEDVCELVLLLITEFAIPALFVAGMIKKGIY